MLIAGLLVVIVFLFLGVLLSHLGSSRETAPRDDVAAPDVAAAVALDPGFAVLDAVPWAEVVRIVALSAADSPAADPRTADSPVAGPPAADSPAADSRTAEEIPITPSRYTPVALELPPGRYRIVLRYPPTGAGEEIEVEVASGARVERRLSFEDLDGKRYFAAIGW